MLLLFYPLDFALLVQVNGDGYKNTRERDTTKIYVRTVNDSNKRNKNLKPCRNLKSVKSSFRSFDRGRGTITK